MWLALVLLAFLYLTRRPKAAETGSPAAGPNSQTDPDLAPARPRTIDEEAARQIALIMNHWRNDSDGGDRA